MKVIVRAGLIGMAVAMAGTLPRNLFYVLNLRFATGIPWAVPVTAIYLWIFWRFLNGSWMPEWSSSERRSCLRANRISGQVWLWSIIAGGSAIVALVIALKLANQMIMLPPQIVPDLSHIPRITVFALLLAGAPIAGIVEEAAFRGYMQGPIEKRHGLVIAVLFTGTMFAVAHLDFEWILWPYYVAVAAIYGSVAYLTNSVLPAIVLHTAGNTYSNLDLLLHGRAEWQAAFSPAALIWTAGIDASFLRLTGLFVVVAAAVILAYYTLARVTKTVRSR